MAPQYSPRDLPVRRIPSRKKQIISPLSLTIGIFVGAALFGLARTLPNLLFPNQFSSRANVLLSAGKDTPPPSDLVAGSGDRVRGANYRSIDELARSLDYQGNSVAELAALLSRFAITPAEKARAIYTWIAYHINYDVSGFLRGNYGDTSPSAVLSSRSTISAGYANLYQALAKEMGLDTASIAGYARGSDYLVGNPDAINHVWNAVKIENAWYLVDPTWGAGTVNGENFQASFNPYYFATPPEQLIYSHFPVRSPWQLLSQAYTKEQFDSLPSVSSNFFADGLELVSPRDRDLATNGSAEIRLRVPVDTLISARIQQNSTPLNDKYLLIQQKNGEATIQAAFPAPGTYELQIFSKRRSDESLLQRSLAYRVTAGASGAAFPKIFAGFSDNNAYLYNPTAGQLPAGQIVPFGIEVPNALEVAVIDGASGKWTPLTRSGSAFVGNVSIGTGKVALAAKFPGNDDYTTLLEYNN
ncbi:transglutaminase domain-containing protein [Pannus brasiliensis CCIBt3594]|uniref:Transglutaminase domain-containing protein n=1 Tax=Pannus brasiliensis CCIBt3594 TaxID=1427578 RepID=A0AAW9QU92_9CHRO